MVGLSTKLGLGRVFVLSLNNHRDTRRKYDDTSFLQVRKLDSESLIICPMAKASKTISGLLLPVDSLFLCLLTDIQSVNIYQVFTLGEVLG